jgi:hypothetical protein
MEYGIQFIAMDGTMQLVVAMNIPNVMLMD